MPPRGNLHIAFGLFVEAHPVLDPAFVVQARGEAQVTPLRVRLAAPNSRICAAACGVIVIMESPCLAPQPVLQARGLRMPAILQACLT